MARASSIIEGKNRISANTNNTNVMSNTYNNIPFNQDNMVVEKNDRFMVFKAVVSNNNNRIIIIIISIVKLITAVYSINLTH